MPATQLTIDRLFDTSTGQNSILRLHGALTADAVSQFQAAFRGLSSDTVLLDLTDVPYLDSAGLGVLVGSYISCQKAGRRVVLIGLNARLARLFEVSRVQQLFLTFATLGEAVDALARAGAA
jgi:anti-sigma B factor antagonist